MPLRSLSFLALSALALVGCYDQGEGVEPPLDRIYFPVGLAMSPGAKRLYVVNSDFDLQYNGGAVQALDLDRVRQLLPKPCSVDAECGSDRVCDSTPTEENGGFPSHWCVDASGPHAGKPCGPFGEKTAASRFLQPGRCGYISQSKPQDGGPSLVVGKVGIGAFATDVIYRARPEGPGGRLFVPVRGDATLHYIDVIDETDSPALPFELDCGQEGNDGDCDDAHRRGDDPEEENTRDLRLAPEPFGVAATPRADAVVVTHQTEGAVSLFVSDSEAWGDGVTSLGSGPNLQFTTTGLPQRAIGVTAVPVPKLVTAQNIEYDPGFLVTYRDAPQVDLLRYFADPTRPFLQAAGSIGITANSLGFDSRGIAIDDEQRVECEKCEKASDQLACLTDCVAKGVRVYAANRAPSTLLVGETRPIQSLVPTDDLPHFTASIPLPFGPSRVVVGKIVNPVGEPETRVFVLCFDSRKVGIYDPETHAIEDWIETGRGPHGFVTELGRDEAGGVTHAYAYVAHFTDSYIGVVDLDQRNPTFGSVLATIGRPSAPRASK